MLENRYQGSLLSMKIVKIIIKNLGRKEYKLDFSKDGKFIDGIIFIFLYPVSSFLLSSKFCIQCGGEA